MNDSKVSEETFLNIVKDGFEDVEGIKILSAFFYGGDMYGIYIVPPQQSLSFVQSPFSDIVTDFMDINIKMIELGQMLYYAYRGGSLEHYFLLTTPSQIKIVSDLFDTLVSKCLNNPPHLQVNNMLIDWLQLTNEVYENRTKTFCKLFEMYKRIDDNLNVNTSISTTANSESQIRNEIQNAIAALKAMTPQKNTEAFIYEIDKLYIQMQTDLNVIDE